MVEGHVTNAALILLGKPSALGRLLPQAEVVFEYRSNDESGPAGDRKNMREGFFGIYDQLWELIQLRNEKQSFQQGLIMKDILTFNERVVRESVLNAVCHRDYRHGASVMIRQFPRRLEIMSPGGFPEGVTVENILDRVVPRNRRIAEVFEKCGFVERSGQGMNLIVEQCIRESKALPDLSKSDDHTVFLTLQGNVQNPKFLSFLEQMTYENQTVFDTHHLLVIDHVYHGRPIPESESGSVQYLVDNEVLERTGRGRGVKVIISRRFASHLDQKGKYTRVKGLDRETNIQLLLKHIKNSEPEGAQFHEFKQVLPGFTKGKIQSLLRELRKRKLAYHEGATRSTRWRSGSNE